MPYRVEFSSSAPPRRLLKSNPILNCWVVFFAVLLIGCSGPRPGRGVGEVESAPAAQVNFRVETVIGNLEVPWSIVWAPDGRMFFTERPGRVRVYQNGQLVSQPIFTVPDVAPSGE